MRELVPPNDITINADRQEVFRAWIDGGMLSTTVCSAFPDTYAEHDCDVVWGMILSDTLHHVADAVSLKTDRDKKDILGEFNKHLSNVILSERGTRSGVLKKSDQRVSELPHPDITEDRESVEMVRVVLVPGFIRIMVMVGMWLPDQEEAVWSNLLYDMAAMIASAIDVNKADVLKFRILKYVTQHIKDPGTEIEGEYYNA